MSTVSRARSLPLAGLLLLVAVANAQTADSPREPAVQTAAPDQAAPAGDLPAAEAAPTPGALRPSHDAAVNQPGSASDSGLVYPQSPWQTAVAIAGALLAIVLAIGGVTLTFRSMREERRGRGRRRSARGDAATTS